MRGILILCLLFVIGCGRSDDSAGPALAKVNDYTITARDFKDELSGNTMMRMASSDVSQAQMKEDILQNMINRQILLEEAQKMGLDRDPKFLKEIEGYWRQTLIKLMLAKKSDEIRLVVKAGEEEVLQEYKLRQKKLLVQIIALNSKAAALELSGAGSDFDSKISGLSASIIRHPDPEWWMSGELAYPVEDIVFGLKVKETSKPFINNGQWMVARVIEEEKLPIAPLDEIKPEITAAVLKKKQERELARWLAELESSAKIERYTDEIKSVNLK